ncbi:branched-chain amino acid ABC transporter permease [Thalassobaculum sp. OXR-137]|uniref:branched-chain amino acid ABC transporter permease n=1 Tax=Thalassobaculum sp. OXR-137 TaxID=3100173 RepID=UPI002AC9A55A|nr:branched-chain amino acid ABC transporter permease [Thalassobaculum sp. OXR-137]WPZ36299.1 branched-chain amino acid ABC transporter permease [Thalassobaculum sp. OXR-137]
MEFWFFIEVVLNGMFAGTMYSLIALGFVLIFKASGVFNFAQGFMVLFAALCFVGFLEMGLPMVVALILAGAIMVAWAFAVERLVLRHLVNQEPIILFMATIGIAFFLEGFGELLWGADVHPLDVGIPDGAWFIGPDGAIMVQQFDVSAAIIAGGLVAALALFFTYTRIGRALRAVADDHQAALSVGIPLNQIWIIVWAVAGLVALVAGIIWGSRLGVQFSLSILALKALPVLILGGFTSVPGAIVGGLIIGIGEKVAEIYLGPYIGGGIEEWFAYVVAMLFLLYRPQGLFGDKIIERV